MPEISYSVQRYRIHKSFRESLRHILGESGITYICISDDSIIDGCQVFEGQSIGSAG